MSERGLLPETRLRSPRFGGNDSARRTCRKNQEKATVVGFGKGVGPSLLVKGDGGEARARVGAGLLCFLVKTPGEL